MRPWVAFGRFCDLEKMSATAAACLLRVVFQPSKKESFTHTARKGLEIYQIQLTGAQSNKGGIML